MYDNWFTTGQSAADGVGTYSRFPARFSIVFQLKAKFCGVIKCHVTGRRARKPAAPLHDPCPKGHVSCRVVSCRVTCGSQAPAPRTQRPPSLPAAGPAAPPRSQRTPVALSIFAQFPSGGRERGPPAPPLRARESADSALGQRVSAPQRLSAREPRLSAPYLLLSLGIWEALPSQGAGGE